MNLVNFGNTQEFYSTIFFKLLQLSIDYFFRRD